MAYLGYKNKAFMEYKREQERVKIWKIKQKAEQARRRKMLRKWKNLSTTFILQLVVVALIIVFYGVFAMAVITDVKADTVKVGDGAFVMAVSYTESYDDLQYVANFPNCDLALDYYNQNCTSANIMLCQQEDKLYMPLDHDTSNEFSSFDFEVNDSQSCGYVGVQTRFTGED
jgi:hypothetical protein